MVSFMFMALVGLKGLAAGLLLVVFLAGGGERRGEFERALKREAK